MTIRGLVTTIEQLEDVGNHVREIIELYGSYLAVCEDTVYFVHQSAKDFLLENALREVFLNGTEETHQAIFLTSLAHLSRTLHRDVYRLEAPGCSIENAKLSEADSLAMSPYPCVYRLDHLYNSKRGFVGNGIGHRQVLDLIDELLRNEYLCWLEGLSLCKSVGQSRRLNRETLVASSGIS